jgi:thioredoxin-related protein
MESFVHETASGLIDRVSFVEKSVDYDRSVASRYGVRGTPTLILIDAADRELSRFYVQLDSASFAAAIELVIANAAVG